MAGRTPRFPATVTLLGEWQWPEVEWGRQPRPGSAWSATSPSLGGQATAVVGREPGAFRDEPRVTGRAVGAGRRRRCLVEAGDQPLVDVDQPRAGSVLQRPPDADEPVRPDVPRATGRLRWAG